MRFRSFKPFQFALLLCLWLGWVSPSAPCPSLDGTSPELLPWTGGQITLLGTGFDSSIQFSVGEKECGNLTLTSSTRAECMAPPSDRVRANISLSATSCALRVTDITLRYAEWAWHTAAMWRTVESTPESPAPRAGHVLVKTADNVLLLHGGLGDGVLFDTVHEFRGETWRLLSTTGTKPAARTEHVAAVLGGELFVFGGWNAQLSSGGGGEIGDEIDVGELAEAEFFGGTFSLNLATQRWQRLTGASDPSPRRGACFASSSQQAALYIMGGHTSSTHVPDAVESTLIRFDLAQRRWAFVAPNPLSPLPPPTVYAAMAATSDAQDRPLLYRHGGLLQSLELSRALWRFDITDATWTLLPPPSNRRGRYMHVLSPLAARLVVHGGFVLDPPEGGCVRAGEAGGWADENCARALPYICRRSENSTGPGQAEGSVCRRLRITIGSPYAPDVDGEYQITDALLAGRAVYRKAGAGPVLFLYSWAGTHWVVGPSTSSFVLEPSAQDRVQAYAVSPALKPEDIASPFWHLVPDTGGGEAAWAQTTADRKSVV